MPTLFRLFLVAGLAAALVFGGMLAIVTFLHPAPHEIVQRIDLPPAK